MKALIIGAAGHLGAALVREFEPRYDVTARAHADLDITDRRAVLAAVESMRPDVILNAAAYNDVDAAERDPGPALEVNAFGVLALARAAARTGAVLVHFSTDFVFDGSASRPYTEDDSTAPQSFYGCTKLLGEAFARDTARHYVLRVESLFGGPTAGLTAREGSLGSIVRKLRAGEEVTVFIDRTVSPSYAPDVARAVREMVDRRIPTGLYHCVNAGTASWDEIAREAAAALGVEPRLRAITLETVRLAAARPKFCALNPAKLASHGIVMRPWKAALADWLGRG